MNGVIGMTEILLDTDLQPNQRDAAETIRDSAEALLGVINDILDFSKIEAGRIELETITFSPSALLAEITPLLGPLARRKGVALITRLDGQLPEAIQGDPMRLRQVLLNLAGNALKFTHHGSVSLELSAQCTSGHAALAWTVRDTGIGMAPEVVERLFSPFYQGDASTTRRFGGTGLGLSICKHLADLMGGSIEVESVLGCGSTFRFTLTCPLGTLSPAKPLAAKEIRLPPGSRILLVEDNLANQKVAGMMLKKLGCETHTVTNGQEALEALVAGAFNLVLMDCQMPVMDGFEATRLIRQNSSGEFDAAIPIIAMTANAMEGDRESCLAAGMDDYLSKPISYATLAATLGRWLEEPA